MKKMFKKSLSVFLAVLMIITVIPMGVYAAETEEIEPIQVSEIKESRDLYSKTYETSEGTNVVISAAVPLHYEEDGELIDIDNTLVKDDDDSSVLTNASNAYNVELPKKYTDDSEIKVDYEGNSIGFKLLNDVKSSKGNIDSADEVDVDESDTESVAYAASNINKLSSSITYKNLLANTDFEYSVQPNTLKENIILNKVPEEDYAIQYELNTGNLTALLNDDNSISLVDSQSNEVFFIESPYIIDSDDNISEDVAVLLEKSDNGYILTYTPDYSLLSSENTIYPIIIDPTVVINSKNKSIDDTYVTDESPTRTKYSLKKCAVGNYINSKNKRINEWSYYKINSFPVLPQGSSVIKATFNISTASKLNDNPNLSSKNNLAIYKISHDAEKTFNIEPSKMTWNNKAPIEDAPIDFSHNTGDVETQSFDISSVIEYWIKNNINNKYLVVKPFDETSQSIPIVSSQVEGNVPCIYFEYSTTKGLSENNQFHSQNLNLAGTSYINDLTGELIIERTEFVTNSSIGEIKFYIGNNVNAPKNNCFDANNSDNSSENFKVSMNYYKTLEYNNVDNGYPFFIKSADGNIEYYTNDEVDIENNTITVTTNKDDQGKTTEIFDSSILPYPEETDDKDKIYFLTGIKEYSDENLFDSEIQIAYNADHCIKSISDSVSYFDFVYDNNSKLTDIAYDSLIDQEAEYYNIDSEENFILDIYNHYSYTDNSIECQLGINDLDYAECFITYEKNDNEIKIITENGNYYLYTLNNGKVIKVQEFSVDGTPGEYLTFEYHNNVTIISDGIKTYTEYFDIAGNLVSIVDQDGNAIFAQYKDNLISKVSQTRSSARNIINFYGFEGNKDTFFEAKEGRVDISKDVKFNGVSSAKLTILGENETFSGKFEKLDQNSTYTVSLWVYQDENTDCSLTLKNGDKKGIFTTTNLQRSDGWQQFYCTIDTESSNEIYIELLGNNKSTANSATIYIDNMYIQKSPYLTNINLLENGDFSKGFDSWTTESNNISIDSQDAIISTFDNNRLKITGDYLSENSISQIVSRYVTDSEGNMKLSPYSKDTKFTYGGWIKTVNSLPNKDGTNRETSICVYGVENDDSFTLLDKTVYSSYFSNWQYIENEITLPNDYSQFKFVVNYNYQTGYAMFDGLSLSQEQLFTTEFEYGGEDGKTIIGITTNETTIDLTEKKDDEEQTTYKSDIKLKDATPTQLEDEEEPDHKYIKIITETATVDDLSKSIVSKFKYENNGSLLTSEMGPLGRWANYKYDYFGNVTFVSDANGNKVEYEYDNFQNLSAIINEFENKYVSFDDREAGNDNSEIYTLKVQYTYTGNRLDKIQTGNEEDGAFVPFNTYAFEYDEWGNQTDIFINRTKDIDGSNDITDDSEDNNLPYIHYEYDETNYHQLNSVSYANGQKIHYIYDDKGNIIYEYDGNNSNGETLSYSYYYYDDGTCYGKKDLISGTVESFQDGLTTVKDIKGNILHVYGYDKNGNLLEQIGDNFVNVTESNSNNSSSIYTTVNNKTSSVETEYDDFGRISTEKILIQEGDTQKGVSEKYILKKYTYYNNKDASSLNSSQTLDESAAEFSTAFGRGNIDKIDEEAEDTRLIRYLTYYYVDGDTTSKISEYRYLYYVNGDTLSCTIVSQDGTDITPGSSDDKIDGFKLTAYNKSSMETGYVNSYKFNSDSGILDLNPYGIYYTYDKQGNIIKANNEIDNPYTGIEFSYDENEYGTNLKNCLTNVCIKDAANSVEQTNQDVNFDFSYDAFGNINNVSSNGVNVQLKNDISIDLSNVDLNWSRGTTLTSITGHANVNYKIPIFDTDDNLPVTLDLIKYKYDDNNLRTNKSINISLDSVTELPKELRNLFKLKNMDLNYATANIDYTWRDGKLVGEEIECSGSVFKEGDEQYGSGAGKYSIIILYDQNGNAYGFNIIKTKDADGNEVSESQTFYYLKDADNTINSIVDEKGKKLVQYIYDSYGMVVGMNNVPGYRYLMLLNPLAYRDYVYDIESGMYYLQARYYAPYIGRFISPDSIVDTGSGTAMCTHLYSYCENNPTNNIDPTGHWAQNYRGFIWTSTGFNLYVNYAFVNKTFCRTYALDILRLKNTLLYKGMSVTRMAAELYFHAIAYYATNALTKIGISNSTIKKWKNQAYYMEINNNDSRVAYFYALWALSNSIIGRYL